MATLCAASSLVALAWVALAWVGVQHWQLVSEFLARWQGHSTITAHRPVVLAAEGVQDWRLVLFVWGLVALVALVTHGRRRACSARMLVLLPLLSCSPQSSLQVSA